MAALWESYAKTSGLSTVLSTFAVEVFHNEVDDHIFASAPITVVDGIVTCTTDGEDLFRVALVIAHESLVAADVQIVDPHEPLMWYRWHVSKGPLVFRLRSKRTIPVEHKLWVQWLKHIGGNTQNCHVGMNLLMVRHQ